MLGAAAGLTSSSASGPSPSPPLSDTPAPVSDTSSSVSGSDVNRSLHSRSVGAEVSASKANSAQDEANIREGRAARPGRRLPRLRHAPVMSALGNEVAPWPRRPPVRPVWSVCPTVAVAVPAVAPPPTLSSSCSSSSSSSSSSPSSLEARSAEGATAKSESPSESSALGASPASSHWEAYCSEWRRTSPIARHGCLSCHGVLEACVVPSGATVSRPRLASRRRCRHDRARL